MIGALLAKRALTGAFAVLNRRDLAAFMTAWRDDAVFVFPGHVPASGTFEGKDAVEGWFRRFLDQFPTIAYTVRDVCVRDLFDLTGTNVAAVHWDIRLTNRDGRSGNNSGVTVIRIERGKVCHVRDFVFDVGDEFRQNWGAGPQTGS
jgi:ketosteroid isomerase-like protein